MKYLMDHRDRLQGLSITGKAMNDHSPQALHDKACSYIISDWLHSGGSKRLGIN